MIFSFILIFLVFILIKQQYYTSDIGRFIDIVKNDGNQNQLKITGHHKIGEKVKFSQPYGYIVRKVDAIVPIVAQIKKELSGIHPKLDSELKNEYIPSNTKLTIVEVYSYSDVINSPSIFYVLADANDNRYVVSEFSFDRLSKPVYVDAIAPFKIFDDLYLDKKSIRMSFFTLKSSNTKLSESTMSNCNIEVFTINKWANEAVAKVNFDQLSCLYKHFWDDFNSKRHPIAFKIID